MLRALQVGCRPREPRLRLIPLQTEDPTAVRRYLDEADLVIAALGYRPRLLPIHDAVSGPLSLLAPSEDRWAVVDGSCRVRQANGVALPGLFATGLAVGPGASSDLGGEDGYRGQTNSLWQWQNTLGRRIFLGTLERAEFRSKARRKQDVPVHQPLPFAATLAGGAA